MVGIADLLGALGNLGDPRNRDRDRPMLPAEREQLRAYGQNAIGNKNRMQPVGSGPFAATHWSQGINDVLAALLGRQAISAANEGERNIVGDRADADRAISRGPPLPGVRPPGPARLGMTTPPGMPPPPTAIMGPSDAPPAPGAGVNTDADRNGFIDRLIQLESGGRPRAYSPSGRHRGLGQFSQDLERRYGINDANFDDPAVQRRAISQHSEYLRGRLRTALNREPTDGEVYLAHQQGEGGGPALLAAGDAPAWRAIRRFYRTDRMAQEAVYQNIPRGNPLGQRQPDQIPASEFAALWTNRFNRTAPPAAPAVAENVPPPQSEGVPPPTTVANNEEPPNGELPPPMGLGAGGLATPPPGQETIEHSDDADEAELLRVQNREPGNVPPPGSGPPPPGLDIRGAPAGRITQEQANELSRGTYPTPPPADLGLPRNVYMEMLALPQAERESHMAARRFQYQPIYEEAPGGRRWTVPATGETGYIPTPRYHMMPDGAGGSIQAVTITDVNGRTRTYTLEPNAGQPAATRRMNLGLGDVPPPGETVPPAGERAPPAGERVAQGDIYEPLPPGSHYLEQPFFQRGQELKRRRDQADIIGRGAAQTVEEARSRGGEAVQLRQLAALMQELENLPGTDRIIEGPVGQRLRAFQTQWNAFFQAGGAPNHALTFDRDPITAAEAISALSTRLAALGARDLSNRPTQFDFQRYLAANPDVMSSRFGRQFIGQLIRSQTERTIALADLAQGWGARDPAEWPRARDEVLNRYSIIIHNGTLFDRNANNIRFDPHTGRAEIRPDRAATRGQILNGYQYTGPDNDPAATENPNNWHQVDVNDQSTWRLRPPQEERRR